MHFVIKLFPEITIKSPPVRKRFTKQLRDNLKKLLTPLDENIRVDRDWEKIEVTGPDKAENLKLQVADILSRTPGIANFSSVQKFPLGDFDDILEKTKQVWADELAGKTFVL